MQFGHAAIEMDAGVCIGCGIDALLLVEMVGFPIGKLSIFGDALTEEVGPQFLEAEVFDAHACGEVLQIDIARRVEVFMAMGKHAPVVVEAETNLEDGGIFE